jgi:hypothetical protein
VADDLARQQRRAAAALQLERLKQAERFGQDPWLFHTQRVQLLDPLRPDDPIRPAPDERYLQIMTEEAERHRRVLIWKPRRMVATWWALAYAVGKALHKPYQRIFLVSRRLGEDDTQGARELLWRCGFILGHLRPQPAIGYQQGKFLITFPNGSTIAPVSSDPDALHGVAGTLVVADEFAYYDEPERSLAAILPTLERRGEIVGQFLGITTTRTGPFERMLYDGSAADEVELDETGVPTWAQELTTYEGMDPTWIRAWTNPGNGFRVIDLNLEADPQKRDLDVLANLQQSVNAEGDGKVWEVQYRKRFLSRGGQPIYGDQFDATRMVRDQLPLIQGEPLLVGLDFGYHRPAACIGQIVPGPQLRIYRAIVGDKTTTKAFVHDVLGRLKRWFPDWHGPILWACDHSGNRKRGEPETAIETLRSDFGIRPKSKPTPPHGIAPQMDRVRDFLQANVGKDPAFLVQKHPDTAFFRRGLAGEYRFAEKTASNPHPEIAAPGNAWRDVMDAMRYLVVNYASGKRLDDERRGQLQRAAVSSVIPFRRHVI